MCSKKLASESIQWEILSLVIMLHNGSVRIQFNNTLDISIDRDWPNLSATKKSQQESCCFLIRLLFSFTIFGYDGTFRPGVMLTLSDETRAKSGMECVLLRPFRLGVAAIVARATDAELLEVDRFKLDAFDFFFLPPCCFLPFCAARC